MHLIDNYIMKSVFHSHLLSSLLATFRLPSPTLLCILKGQGGSHRVYEDIVKYIKPLLFKYGKQMKWWPKIHFGLHPPSCSQIIFSLEEKGETPFLTYDLLSCKTGQSSKINFNNISTVRFTIAYTSSYLNFLTGLGLFHLQIIPPPPPNFMLNRHTMLTETTEYHVLQRCSHNRWQNFPKNVKSYYKKQLLTIITCRFLSTDIKVFCFNKQQKKPYQMLNQKISLVSIYKCVCQQ